MTVSSPPSKALVYTLGILGFYGTWIRSAINGTLLILYNAVHVTKKLPGSQIPIKTSFTGIYWPIDYVLSILVPFSWQAVDGSHPTTSLFGMYFAGQYLSIIVILYLDSYRSDRHGWRYNPTLWLLVFQLTAFAASGPWIILQTIPFAQIANPLDLSKVNLNAIHTLPLSIISGYILPYVLIALPSTGTNALVSSSLQQIFIAAWSFLPFLIAISQSILQNITVFYSSPTKVSTVNSPLRKEAAISTIRRNYAFAFFLSLATHIATLTITFSTILFPVLFSPHIIRSLHPREIYSLPLSHASAGSLGVGALQFLQWDIVVGFTTMLVPAVTSYHRVQNIQAPKSNLFVLTLKTLGAVVALGPGATLVGVRWLEDEALLFQGAKGGEVAAQGKRR